MDNVDLTHTIQLLGGFPPPPEHMCDEMIKVMSKLLLLTYVGLEYGEDCGVDDRITYGEDLVRSAFGAPEKRRMLHPFFASCNLDDHDLYIFQAAATFYADFLLKHRLWTDVRKKELPILLKLQKVVANRNALKSVNARIDKKLKRQANMAKIAEERARLAEQNKVTAAVQMQELREKRDIREARNAEIRKAYELERRGRIASERERRDKEQSNTAATVLKKTAPKKKESCAAPSRPKHVKLLSISSAIEHSESLKEAEDKRVAELEKLKQLRMIGDSIQRGD